MVKSKFQWRKVNKYSNPSAFSKVVPINYCDNKNCESNSYDSCKIGIQSYKLYGSYGKKITKHLSNKR